MNDRACASVGIDLGTTYSAMAYMDKHRTPRMVCDSSGQSVMPSAVYFAEEDIIVGELALSQAQLSPERVVQFIKIHMGDHWRREFGGRMHTPESISALILGQLVREAAPLLGPVQSAVITVPAYFTEKRRRATQQAGELAGLRVKGILNEPIAATLAYGLYRTDQEELAVVYDLGGGTFDVTIVRIAANVLEELATSGNRQLGGRDWDRALIELVAEKFQKRFGNDLCKSPQALQDLQVECERAKRRLGRMARTSIRLLAFGHDYSQEIAREEFEAQTAHLVQATRLTTENALEDARLRWSDISRVVLVGGSSHMPAVRRMLEQVSGRPPDTGVNPVLAVALGAGIYAHILDNGKASKKILLKQDGDEDEIVVAELVDDSHPDWPFTVASEAPVHDAPRIVSREISDSSKEIRSERARQDETVGKQDDDSISGILPRVRFVTAHGVGVKVRMEHGWKNSVLIPRNTPVPTTCCKRFFATGDALQADRISIIITQGDTSDVDLAEVLGVGEIELSKKESVGNPVDVILRFDPQGRLHADAVYVPTGERIQLRLEVHGCLREDEMPAYRELMQTSGFVTPFSLSKAMAGLSSADKDDDDDDLVPFLGPK